MKRLSFGVQHGITGNTQLCPCSPKARAVRAGQSSISDIGEAEPDSLTTGWLTVYAKDDSHFKVRAEEIWKDRDEKSLGLQIGSHPQVLTHRP